MTQHAHLPRLFVMIMLGQAAVVASEATCDGNATCAEAQEEEVSMLSHWAGQREAVYGKQCGAIVCAGPESTCCDEAPAALCGSPGSTCCYNPGKTIANLCAPGTHCNADGNCVADNTMFKCGNIYCSSGTTCCDK